MLGVQGLRGLGFRGLGFRGFPGFRGLYRGLACRGLGFRGIGFGKFGGSGGIIWEFRIYTLRGLGI